MGYSPWGCKELDTTEPLSMNIHNPFLFGNQHSALFTSPSFFLINIYLLKKVWPHPVLVGSMQALLLGL